jgi:hypothetical protein
MGQLEELKALLDAGKITEDMHRKLVETTVGEEQRRRGAPALPPRLPPKPAKPRPPPKATKPKPRAKKIKDKARRLEELRALVEAGKVSQDVYEALAAGP